MFLSVHVFVLLVSESKSLLELFTKSPIAFETVPTPPAKVDEADPFCRN